MLSWPGPTLGHSICLQRHLVVHQLWCEAQGHRGIEETAWLCRLLGAQPWLGSYKCHCQTSHHSYKEGLSPLCG